MVSASGEWSVLVQLSQAGTNVRNQDHPVSFTTIVLRRLFVVASELTGPWPMPGKQRRSVFCKTRHNANLFCFTAKPRGMSSKTPPHINNCLFYNRSQPLLRKPKTAPQKAVFLISRYDHILANLG